MTKEYRTVTILLVILFLFGSGFCQPAWQSNPPSTDTLKVAFIGPDRHLYTWTAANGTAKVFDAGDLNDLKISDDGSLIAFTRQSDENQNSLWICGFDGSHPREVMTWFDLSSLKTNPDSTGAGPTNLKWIPGTHTLTFTSHEVFEGPGMALNDDLVTVDGDTGEWYVLLKPGHGGAAAFSPDGQWMALSTPSNISVMDVHGIPAPGPGIDFTPVMTYSEYQYYPSPVWAADSTRLAVFIPTDDPLKEPRGKSSIWTMDVKGSKPVRQVQVTPQFIGPVTISPDLTKFFYVREAGNPADNRRELRTALINGMNGKTVFSGSAPDVYGWAPDGEVFAYRATADDPITVSQINGSVGDLPGTHGAYWFSWVDSSRFLFSKVTGDSAELFLGNRKEDNQLLAALPVSEYFRMIVDFVQ